jgi:hypothetical protein
MYCSVPQEVGNFYKKCSMKLVDKETTASRK